MFAACCSTQEKGDNEESVFPQSRASNESYSPPDLPRVALPAIGWEDNLVLATDSYKFSHWKQYPKGTEYVYSYFESRGCDREGWSDVCFFGLQYFIKRYLMGQVITREKIDEAEAVCKEHFMGDGLFYKEGFEYILEKHGGRLPISIKALPEETLLVQVWYPMTVCSNSRNQKMSIHKAMEETGNEDWGIPGGSVFKLHDFGFRGVSSVESAALGGAGHLVNFMGTDTVAALQCTKRYYGAKKAAGFSIPASEHSTITSWGVNGEADAMRNMLTEYPEGLVACVSDSFDVFKACKDYWGDQLKSLVKGRISGNKWGRLVVRPDSGDPTETCKEILRILCEQFKEDVTTTKTGHKLLPPYIRVIQGDGVDWETVPKILASLKDAGYAADNMVFGSGGALLQKLNRDTFKCAFKCSEITVNGKSTEVFKDPITDKGKASKKGRLTVQLAETVTGFKEEDKYKPRDGEKGIAGGTGFLHYSADGKYVTVSSGKGDPSKDLLVEVFKDGQLLKDYTLDEIRARADIPNGPFRQGAAASGAAAGEQVISLTIKKEGPKSMGLDIRHENKDSLNVASVLPTGFAKEWNEKNPGQAIKENDTIIEVNNVSGPTAAAKMVEAMVNDTTLVLKIKRTS